MFNNKLSIWKKKFLSKGGRLTVIKSTLFNLPIYRLSVLNIPSKVAKKLEMVQCNFLWGDSDNCKKYHLVNWLEVKKPLRDGGLGLRSLIKLNEALLGKWIWRFWNKNDSLWKMVIDCKWFNGNPYDFSCIKSCNYSLSLWKNIMNLNSDIFQCSMWNIGNGHNVPLMLT